MLQSCWFWAVFILWWRNAVPGRALNCRCWCIASDWCVDDRRCPSLHWSRYVLFNSTIMGGCWESSGKRQRVFIFSYCSDGCSNEQMSRHTLFSPCMMSVSDSDCFACCFCFRFAVKALLRFVSKKKIIFLCLLPHCFWHCHHYIVAVADKLMKLLNPTWRHYSGRACLVADIVN